MTRISFFRLLALSSLCPVMLAHQTYADPVRVFFGTGGDEGIHTAMLDEETGKLSALSKAADLNSSGFISMSSDGKYLYSTGRDANSQGVVVGYKVGENGKLESLNMEQCMGKGPCFVGLDKEDKMLMVANYGSGSVAAFGINEDGSIKASDSHYQHEGSSVNENRQKGPHAHSIYPGPDNRFAYAPDLGIDEVVIYSMKPEEGKLTQTGSAKTPPGSGPRHMKFSPEGKYAYVLSELTLTVVVYKRNPENGFLEMLHEVDVLPEGSDKEGMTCSEILVSKGGRYVYTANRDTLGQGRDSLTMLKVGEETGMERVQTIPAEVHIPRNINLSPSGKWLLVAGQKEGGVPVFAVGDDGKLEFSDHRMELKNAMCIVFAPN